MPAQRTGGGSASLTWSAWYYCAREEMAFQYGKRGIPKDTYKEQYALGVTPGQAVKAIYTEMQSRGEY